MEKNKRAFLHSTQFDDIWERLGLDDKDLRNLQNTIIKNPDAGKVLRGTGGFRKMRFSREGGGKSGGYRVIYGFAGIFVCIFADGLSEIGEGDTD